MTELTVVSGDEPPSERSLSRLMPRNVKELAFFGNQAAASGLFTTFDKIARAQRNITGQEAFLLMSQGVELGLSPLQALRELNLIDGRVDVPASVRAAKICASPKVTQWDAVCSPLECTITAKRSDRTTVCSVTVKRADMNAADVARHKDHVEDWLYARAVRKISRRYFPDFALGIDSADEFDPEKVIDVRRVEQAIDVTPETEERTWPCAGCGGRMTLEANRRGGAYLRCQACGATESPPQEVRDLIRGTPAALTIAASDEEVMPSADVSAETEPPAVLAPADVTPPPSEESAVQSETDGGASENEHSAQEAAPDATDEPPAPVDPAMVQWRARSLSAIAKYLGEHRTPETGREATLAELAKAGWDPLSGVTLAAFLRTTSDEDIATMIGAFAIDVPA